MSWEPIETAPKDGTWILAFCPASSSDELQWAVTRFCDGMWEIDASDDRGSFSTTNRPSHWQPLPEPPLRIYWHGELTTEAHNWPGIPDTL
jgi:hypothetical protein